VCSVKMRLELQELDVWMLRYVKIGSRAPEIKGPEWEMVDYSIKGDAIAIPSVNKPL
jgi:hypothetical protein